MDLLNLCKTLFCLGRVLGGPLFSSRPENRRRTTEQTKKLNWLFNDPWLSVVDELDYNQEFFIQTKSHTGNNGFRSHVWSENRVGKKDGKLGSPTHAHTILGPCRTR